MILITPHRFYRSWKFQGPGYGLHRSSLSLNSRRNSVCVVMARLQFHSSHTVTSTRKRRRQSKIIKVRPPAEQKTRDARYLFVRVRFTLTARVRAGYFALSFDCAKSASVLSLAKERTESDYYWFSVHALFVR